MTEEEIQTIEKEHAVYARYDLPGPVDWERSSHWVEYDHEKFTVELWCSMGPNFRFKLRQRVRPMSEGEVIFSKLRHHSREAVLACFGITEKTRSPPPPKRSWWARLFQ